MPQCVHAHSPTAARFPLLSSSIINLNISLASSLSPICSIPQLCAQENAGGEAAFREGSNWETGDEGEDEEAGDDAEPDDDDDDDDS